MNIWFARLTVFWLLLGAVAAWAPSIADASETRAANERPTPVNVIFDTDMWSDIDDMFALAMLHALQDRHEVNLVAVTISTDDPWCASYVDLVNTFYRHPHIPVGIVHDGLSLDGFRKMFPATTWPVTRYTEMISKLKDAGGAPLYPHRMTDGSKAPEAVSLLRKTLAAQPDGSVVIILVGYSTNLARLLESKADAASPLDGPALVARKVRLLSVMAGNFKDAQAAGKAQPPSPQEFNLMVDVPAAQKVFAAWPTPIVDSGFEIGVSLLYPGSRISSDYNYVPHHPIADTYRSYCEEMKAGDASIKQCPAGHDHPTWDLTAVLYGARPDRGYFQLSKPGKITILPNGSSSFEEVPGGTHRYLILDGEQKARILEAMEMLASQPPS